MEIKNLRTNDEGKFIEKLEDLLEKAKAGRVAKCSIRAAILEEPEAKSKDRKKSEIEEMMEMVKSFCGINDDDDDEDDEEEECDDEECELEDTPEETFDDLRMAIGCMAYYGIPLPKALVAKYNNAYWEKNEDADGEDS